MSARPRATAAVTAALTEQAPSRLVRKLDADPRCAEAWTWAAGEGAWTVTTATGEVVSLRAPDGVVRRVEDVGCTCLLAPRCLHVLASVSLLELAEAEWHAEEPAAEGGATADEAAATAPAQPGPEGPATSAALSPAQVEAREAVWRAGVALLDLGALGAGPVPQAELLRAVHACRAAGLHRLERAGLRVVQGVRELREERPSFALEALRADLFDLLGTCHRLRSAAPDPVRVGQARRAFAALGGLALRGVFAEAVQARTGYAGVVTHLCDEAGRLWSVSGVLPGGSVDGAYTGQARLGGAALTHEALARHGVLIQGATGSADGRLGSGQGVRAVRGQPCSWDDPALRRLFAQPLAAQVARAWAALGTPPLERPGGADLLWLRGTILGASQDALWVAVAPAPGEPPRPVRCVPPSRDPARPTLANLRLLAQAGGATLRLIGRLVPGRARTVALLAVGPDAADPDAAGLDATEASSPSASEDASAPACPAQPAPTLALPEAWGSVCNVTLDVLRRVHLPGAAGEPYRFEAEDDPDPWTPLRRRLERLVLGGRGNLPASAGAELDRERALLQRRLCTTGAAQLAALFEVALDVGRAIDGRRASGDAARLATAWLRATVYLEAATQACHAQAWGAPWAGRA